MTDRSLMDNNKERRSALSNSFLPELTNVLNSENAASWCDKLRSLAISPSFGDSQCRRQTRSILHLMDSFQDDICVQKSGLLAVAALCENRHLAEQIGNDGGIRQLTKSWKKFRLDDVLVKDAIVTMRSLSNVDRNKEEFCSLDGIELLTSSMIDFPSYASIQAASAALLANICFESDERKFKAVKCGVVKTILKTLQRFPNPECVRLHANACLALRNLSLEASACDHIKAEEENIDIIVEMVASSRNRPSVGREVLGIVLNIATMPGTEDSITLYAQKIAPAIIAFLRLTTETPVTHHFNHELCFAIMRNMLVQSTGILDRKQRDEFLEHAIRYGETQLSCFSPNSATIISSVCSCVRAMLMDSDTRRYFSDLSGGIEMLIEAVSHLSGRPLQVEHALVALGNAVFDDLNGKLRVQKLGGIEIVRNILSKNYYIANVAEACLMAVHAICSMNDRNGDIATRSMVHRTCVQAMRALADNAAIQERGLAAIVSLGSGTKAVDELRRNSVCEVAQAAARAFPFSKAIRAQEMKINDLVRGEPAFSQRTNSGNRFKNNKGFWKQLSRS